MGESSSGGRIRQDVAGRIRLDQASGRLVLTDTSNNIIGMLGFNDQGAVSFSLVPPGKDVRTAAGKDFIINSAFPTMTVADADIVTVTRKASNDSNYNEVSTGVLGAPMFFCTVRAPSGSPSFRHMCPFLSYFTTGANSGKLISGKRALYDPSTGVVRFFVESTDINPSYATDETWEFQYFLLYQNIPS